MAGDKEISEKGPDVLDEFVEDSADLADLLGKLIGAILAKYIKRIFDEVLQQVNPFN